MAPTTFFSLPAELRLIIYGYYFYQLQITVVPRFKTSKDSNLKLWQNYRDWVHLPILLASRQLHKECLSFVFEKATFDFTLRPSLPVYTARFRRCRHISVFTAVLATDYLLQRFIDTMPSVKSVTVELTPRAGATMLRLPRGIKMPYWNEGTEEHAQSIAKDVRVAWQNVLDTDDRGGVTKARKIFKAATQVGDENVTSPEFYLQIPIFRHEENKMFDASTDLLTSTINMNTGDITLRDRPPYTREPRTMHLPAAKQASLL